MSEEINWKELSDLEEIKYNSNYLHGTLKESLADSLTGAISPADRQISKFHGTYLQWDRDIDKERKQQKLEPAYSFLIRVRMPGGIINPQQWLKMDALADSYANGTLKMTTRQTFQLHGVLKKNLKKTISQINDSLLDTIAACGDVNRNVMCHANPAESPLYPEIMELAKKIGRHLLPQTTAYHEIWLDKKLVVDSKEEIEPLYGRRYLPRKFKIGTIIPPQNDCDIFSQDLGFIAIVKKEKITGYNIVVGGGLGSTFGMPSTYPRTGSVIGFCKPEQVLTVAEQVIRIQRDYGDRKNRKNARLKYTIDRLGLDWFINELQNRSACTLGEAKSFKLTRTGDNFGWKKGTDNKWHLTYFVEGGRIKNDGKHQLKNALREIADISDGNFILTGNQNVIIAGVSEKVKKQVETILKKHNVSPGSISGLRKNSISCVALPTCPLAFAEAERYLPTLITQLEKKLQNYGLLKEEIVIRMTGCPNGCGRPYLAEIGLIGKSSGYYNLYLGGSFNGDRLNRLYKETLSENDILKELDHIFKDYAVNRKENEKLGDFVIRSNYVTELKQGKDFQH